MFKFLLLFSLFFSSLFSFDINSASADDFTEIKGIGTKIASRIIEYRDENGLNSVDDLLNVKGVGKRKLERIKNHIDNPESETDNSSDDDEVSPIDLSKYDD